MLIFFYFKQVTGERFTGNYWENGPSTRESTHEPFCPAQNGTALFQTIGSLFEIQDMRDCGTAALYYTKEFGKAIPEAVT